ncbi:hypothetical protein [Ensifer sp. SL37]|uniref:hypothetical protein n=1 Tax=Ensifer sp. SL37 TaxID=2995137 RepID=UPI0022731CDC|nr:hypothetical protein [Ensifer sp. SL37]MCY1746297.1 hypothetical protein [Ensifer sp. SL37]
MLGVTNLIEIKPRAIASDEGIEEALRRNGETEARGIIKVDIFDGCRVTLAGGIPGLSEGPHDVPPGPPPL